jgi:hypothetical protein
MLCVAAFVKQVVEVMDYILQTLLDDQWWHKTNYTSWVITHASCQALLFLYADLHPPRQYSHHSGSQIHILASLMLWELQLLKYIQQSLSKGM